MIKILMGKYTKYFVEATIILLLSTMFMIKVDCNIIISVIISVNLK